jgi:hypothetical protein
MRGFSKRPAGYIVRTTSVPRDAAYTELPPGPPARAGQPAPADELAEPGLGTLDGNVAVVTGGASGIGRTYSGGPGAEGMQVVIADIDCDPLDRAAAGGGGVGRPNDVGNAASVQQPGRAVMERFEAVHVVCTNAGSARSLRTRPWFGRRIADAGLKTLGRSSERGSFLPFSNGEKDGGHTSTPPRWRASRR